MCYPFRTGNAGIKHERGKKYLDLFFQCRNLRVEANLKIKKISRNGAMLFNLRPFIVAPLRRCGINIFNQSFSETPAL